MTETWLRDTQLAARFGVSRQTIYRWVAKGIFPKPHRLTIGWTRWRESEIVKFENDKLTHD